MFRFHVSVNTVNTHFLLQQIMEELIIKAGEDNMKTREKFPKASVSVLYVKHIK